MYLSPLIEAVKSPAGSPLTVFGIASVSEGSEPSVPLTFDEQVALDAPVSYWELEETAAGDAVDTMGIENGAYNGDSYPTMFYGFSGNSLIATDGTLNSQRFYNNWDERVEIPNNAAHNFTGTAYTIAFWTKRTRKSATERLMARDNGGAYSVRQWEVFFHSSGELRFNHITAALAQQSVSYIGPNEYYDNQPHFIAAVNDGTDMVLYVDGVEVSRNIGAGGSSNSCAQNIALAASSIYTTGNYSGLLHKCAIYNKELTATRIAAQYKSGSGYDAGAYSLHLTTYASKSLLLAGTTPNLTGLRISNSGNTLYQCDSNNVVIRQSTLSTAYDLSTASDAGAFDCSTQIGAIAAITGVDFNTDGTKMYIACFDSNIYQCSLSTAYDVSSASYDSVSIDLSASAPSLQDIRWAESGDALYVVESSTDTIRRYSATTPYDLSSVNTTTASSFSVATEETIPKAIAVHPDNTAIFVSGISSDKVYRYVITTVGDLSTCVVDPKSYDLTTESIAAAAGIDFSTDGTKLYVADGATDTSYQYTNIA